MIAKAPSGKTIVVQTRKTARPLDPFHALIDEKSFQVSAQHGSNFVLGVLNLTTTDLTESMPSFSDIAPGADWEKFVVKSFKGGILDQQRMQNESMSLKLGEWDVITAAPKYALTGPKMLEIAILGLLPQMVGIAAVGDAQVGAADSPSSYVEVELRAVGELGKSCRQNQN